MENLNIVNEYNVVEERVLYTGGSNNAVIEFYNGVSPNGTWVAAFHSGGGNTEDLEIHQQKAFDFFYIKDLITIVKYYINTPYTLKL